MGIGAWAWATYATCCGDPWALVLNGGSSDVRDQLIGIDTSARAHPYPISEADYVVTVDSSRSSEALAGRA
jgi:hypothetical protein